MDPELRWELVCPPLFRTQPSLTVAPLRHGRTCHPSSFCKPLSVYTSPYTRFLPALLYLISPH